MPPFINDFTLLENMLSILYFLHTSIVFSIKTILSLRDNATRSEANINLHQNNLAFKSIYED